MDTHISRRGECCNILIRNFVLAMAFTCNHLVRKVTCHPPSALSSIAVTYTQFIHESLINIKNMCTYYQSLQVCPYQAATLSCTLRAHPASQSRLRVPSDSSNWMHHASHDPKQFSPRHTRSMRNFVDGTHLTRTRTQLRRLRHEEQRLWDIRLYHF
jgi:hypothetical protein